MFKASQAFILQSPRSHQKFKYFVRTLLFVAKLYVSFVANRSSFVSFTGQVCSTISTYLRYWIIMLLGVPVVLTLHTSDKFQDDLKLHFFLYYLLRTAKSGAQ